MFKSAICMLEQVCILLERVRKNQNTYLIWLWVFRTMGTKFVTNDVTLMEVVGGFFNAPCITFTVNKNSGTFL